MTKIIKVIARFLLFLVATSLPVGGLLLADEGSTLEAAEGPTAHGAPSLSSAEHQGQPPDQSPDQPPSPAGLLLITLDTTRADALGTYADGSAGPSPTPVLDALAARGLRFERAITSAPLTLPAHASLFTGRTPPGHGVRDNATDSLAEEIPTLAATLQEQGYATGAIVASRVLDRRFGLDRGFDLYDDRPTAEQVGEHGYAERTAEQVTELALAWIDQRPKDQPFFLWVHFYDPHFPYTPPDLPRNADPRMLYQAEVSLCDRKVGELLGQVPETTVVAVVGDHGESLGEHGERTHGLFLYNSVLEVPLIVAGPGVPRGSVVSEPVATRRLPASLLHLLGADSKVEAIPGPVLPSLMGSRQPGRDGTKTDDRNNDDPNNDGPNNDGPNNDGPNNDDPNNDGPLDSDPIYSETLLPATAYGWSALHAVTGPRYRLIKAPRPELYDLVDDPAESKNLVRQERAAARRLETSLDRHMEVSTPRRQAPMDAELRKSLSQLGYLSGASSDQASTGAADARSGEQLDPKDGIELLGRFDRAKDLRMQGDLEAAVALLDELVRANPRNVPFLTQLALARFESGEVDAGLTLFRAAIALNPAYEFPRMRLASALTHLGRLDEARTELEAVLELDPRFADAWLALGQMSHRAGDPAGERDYLEKAAAAGTSSAGLFVRLGQLRAAGGGTRAADLQAAVEALRQATELAPAWPLAWMTRAELQVRLGDTDGARASLANVLRLAAPQSDEYRQAQALLRRLG